MKRLLPIALLIALTASGAARASVDCHRATVDWQPREAVTARAAELGLTTDSLRIDDGCYELRGRDADGNWVTLTFEPATLTVLELGVRFRPGADTSRYWPGTRGQVGKSNKPHPSN